MTRRATRSALCAAAALVAAAVVLLVAAAAVRVRAAPSISAPDLLVPSFGDVSYVLTAEDGCFHWSSTHPDVIRVEPIAVAGTAAALDSGSAGADADARQQQQQALLQQSYQQQQQQPQQQQQFGQPQGSAAGVGAGQCTGAVRVTTVTRDSGQRTGTVLAEDVYSGRVLRCEVVVADIAHVEVLTTRRLVHVDDFLLLEVQAFDAEGNVFSSIEGLPFAWSVRTASRAAATGAAADDIAAAAALSRGGQAAAPLRLVQFRDAAVKASKTLHSLEASGRTTEAVVVKGMSPGRATVRIVLTQAGYEHVPPAHVEIAVVEPLQLDPMRMTLLPPAVELQYRLMRLYAEGAHVVPMPDARYVWRSSNQTVATVDRLGLLSTHAVGGMTVTALDEALPEGATSAVVGVVPPAYIHLQIVAADDGSISTTWVLTSGRKYLLDVTAMDDQGRAINVVPLMHYSIGVDKQFIASDLSSRIKNRGTSHRFELDTLVKGSTFVEATISHGRTPAGWPALRARQEIMIVDPVHVSPKLALLPLDARVQHSYRLSASGGSGRYEWRSIFSQSLSVSPRGVVNGTAAGEFEVIASDAQCSPNRDNSTVVLAPVAALSISGPVDVFIGATARLDAIAFDALRRAFTNDSMLPMEWSVEPAGIVELSHVHLSDANVTAVAEGEAIVTVTYLTGTGVTLVAHHQLIAASPLRALIASKRRAIATLASSVPITFDGGPAPWPREDVHSAVASANVTEGVQLRRVGSRSFEATCLRLGDYAILVRVGNNAKGGVFQEDRVLLSCARPASLNVHPVLLESSERYPACDVDAGRTYFVPSDVDTPFRAVVFTREGLMFDNFSSLQLDWASDMSFGSLSRMSISSVMRLFSARSKLGAFFMHVSSPGYNVAALARLSISDHTPALSADISVTVAPHVSIPAPPSSLVLHPRNAYRIAPVGGSGRYQFRTNETTIGLLLEQTQSVPETSMQPRAAGRMVVFAEDACMPLQEATVELHISPLTEVQLHGPSIDVTGAHVGLRAAYLDTERREFHSSQLRFLNVSSRIDGCSSMIAASSNPSFWTVTSKLACVGSVTVIAQALHDGTVVSSDAHQLTIIAPVRVTPSTMRLVPCASQQLMLAPTGAAVKVSFVISNRTVADVSPDGTVHALVPGHARVSAVAEVMDGGQVRRLSTATCDLYVAVLSGIRIVAPTLRARADQTLPLRIEGSFGEPPTAFDSAGTTYEWDTTQPNVAAFATPYPGAPTGFAMNVDGRTVGKTHISARISLPSCGNVPALDLRDSVALSIVDPLRVVLPLGAPGELLVPPHGVARIHTNKDGDPRVHFALLSNDSAACNISVSASGEVASHGSTGRAFVLVEDSGAAMSTVVTVHVRPVHAVALRPAERVSTVPVGSNVLFEAILLDVHGNAFATSQGYPLEFARSFDIVDVLPGTRNGTVTVRALQQGRAVVHVRSAESSAIEDYIWITIGNLIRPAVPFLHLGGSATFSVPESRDGQWSASDRSVLDVQPDGTCHAVGVGKAALYHNGTVRTHTALAVVPVSLVRVVPLNDAVINPGTTDTTFSYSVRFFDSHGHALDDGPSVSQGIEYSCRIEESMWAFARAQRRDGATLCRVHVVRPDPSHLRKDVGAEALTLSIAVGDVKHSYTYSHQERLPFVTPLIASAHKIELSELKPSDRVLVHGVDVQTELRDENSCFAVRLMSESQTSALFEVSAVERAEACAATLVLRSKVSHERAEISLLVLPASLGGAADEAAGVRHSSSAGAIQAYVDARQGSGGSDQVSFVLVLIVTVLAAVVIALLWSRSSSSSSSTTTSVSGAPGPYGPGTPYAGASPYSPGVTPSRGFVGAPYSPGAPGMRQPPGATPMTASRGSSSAFTSFQR